MKKEETLRLLVIDDSSNDTENVSNQLRNAGHPVRAQRVEDDEDLREALAHHGWDMILSKPAIPYFTAADVLITVRQLEMAEELPLLILDDGSNETAVFESLQAGARDAVPLNQPQRLVHAVLREFDDLQRRRRHHACEKMLLEANTRAQGLVDSSRDSIAYVHEGMHIYANHSYLETFGYSDQSEIEGLPLMNLVAPDDQKTLKAFLRHYDKEHDGEHTLALQGLRADGSTPRLNLEFYPVIYDGEHCTQIVIRDQTLNKELEQKLDHLSKQDLLTGVYNRQYFMEVLGRYGKAAGHSGAVLLVEPDAFQQLRDDAGIAAGDMFITELASVLNSQLENEKDFVARLEGHIFTVMVHDVGEKEIHEVAERILKAVEKHIFEVGQQSRSTTCSIGISLFNDAFRDPQQVLERADRAHRNVVEAGGNGVELYNPVAAEMMEQERLAVWGKQIKQALRNNDFRLIFQPIVSLQGDPQENYEVLLRMLDENGREIRPAEFLPAAEQAKLMSAVDRWVIMHAVKTLAKRRRAGHRTNFFIKLSGDSLKDPRLLPWLSDLMKASRLEANSLTLEINETVAANNIKALKILTDGLGQLRIRTAIDHCGQAANYLNLMRHCEANFLKISGQLVNGMASDNQARERVEEIIRHAQQAGRSTIAEYVEDANTLAQLYASGVDYIQGHFLQQPDSKLDYDFSSM